MTDTLDFVKSLWGSMGVPGLATPTLSVDELDKKINELKAVEGWLSMNSTMLRSSIQALEVQRGTIATLKSMGQSLADSMQQKPGKPEKSLYDANPYAAAFFSQFDPARLTPKPPAATSVPKPPEVKPEAKVEARPEPKPAEEGGPKPDLAAAAAAQMANPAIWWNMLQDQFKQAVTTAMTAEGKPAAFQAPGNGNGNGTAGSDGTGDSGGSAAQAEPETRPEAGAARKAPVRKTAPKKE
ncbi:hypothetical protein GJV26_10535 [Massilia dura]|uniref:Tfp pilus assembly protein FimV n=2 Tax=Pseudoduganella dura TaxID=321982 RepID=A0A6I3XGW7_9BURK|nr:hypothetical protein [Pseudoduganella dura]